MNCVSPYTKQQVQDAFDNVLMLAHEKASMDKIEGFECADDIIAEQSLIIVEHVRNMINNTSEHE